MAQTLATFNKITFTKGAFCVKNAPKSFSFFGRGSAPGKATTLRPSRLGRVVPNLFSVNRRLDVRSPGKPSNIAQLPYARIRA